MPALAQDALVLHRIAHARAQTDKLFRLVHTDALYDRPIPERHRIIFYVGHLEAFDWNLLQSRLPGLKPFDTGLDRLFAFGIDPVNGNLPSDRPADWPRLKTIGRYTARIRAQLDAALETGAWRGEESPALILNAAIEHRLMHAETLAYMLHRLPFACKNREEQTPLPETSGAGPSMTDVPAGVADLGLRWQHDAFGWDNEYEAHQVHVTAFAVDRHKVTNFQFLQFLEAGGYRDESFWSQDNWKWIAEQGIEHPELWKRTANTWTYRTMSDEIPLPPAWPVYVSHAEAEAYAKWSGKRLPTEAEWHRTADSAHAEGLFGTGWEWTSTEFTPFPGFRPFPFYPGYSADFFDGLHFVLKGGSPRTDPCMLRRSFRNWFQARYQYAYTGFRCVKC